MTFHLEAMQTKEIHDIVESFRWSGGHVHKRARITKGGLIAAVVESWSPPRPSHHEFSVLLEDDIVLAPTAREWLEKTLPWCAKDPVCAGVSLYTPRIHELTRSRPRRDKLLKTLPKVYGQQLPCSWGAAFKSEHWSNFRLWMEHRLSVDTYEMPYVLDMGLMTGWENSWKKFYTEVTLLRGWYLLYPNFNNQTSFSTNMLEVGEHIKKGGVHKAKDYNLPLAETLPSFEFPERLSILDPMDYHVPWLPEPKSKTAKRFTKLANDQHLSRREMALVCKRYNGALHSKMIQFGNESQTTLVMSHFIRTARSSLIANRPWMLDLLEHYCSMGVIQRIVVVWHNIKVALPRKMLCPNGVTSIVFTRGDGRNRLMNRFYPSALITTPSVVTIDDDIFVDESDLENMVRIWLNNRKAVVGPFARYYTSDNEYTIESSKAAREGYPIILTKIHVSAQTLFHDVYCRRSYSRYREFVNKHTNCEDLLYIRAAIDSSRSSAPAVIKYAPKCPVIDLGKKGLHRRKKHQEQRTLALQSFNLLNAEAWQTKEYTFQDVDTPIEYKHSKKKVETSLSDFHNKKKAEFPMCYKAARVPAV